MQGYIEVRIAKEFLSPENPMLGKRVLWGSDTYTSDSDAVCVLHHSGHFRVRELHPPEMAGVSAVFRVVKARNQYTSSLRNGLKSQKRVAYDGHSLKPEGVITLDSLGNLEELTLMAPSQHTRGSRKSKPTKSVPEGRELAVTFSLSLNPILRYSLEQFGDKFSLG